MTTMTGSKLITMASLFGSAAIIFTTIPFVFILLHGIAKSKDNTPGGMNVMNVACMAFFTHFIATVGFMTTIYMLDIFNKTQSRYFSEKIFGIFWANDKSTALGLAGVSGNDNSAEAAYLTLHTIHVVADMFYLLVPILVLTFAIAYGISQSQKDVYRENVLSMFTFCAISAIVAMILYIAWASIASFGLFLPGTNLTTHTSSLWEAALL